MTIGVIEIGLIIIVVFLVLFMFRIGRMGRKSDRSIQRKMTGEQADTGAAELEKRGVGKYSTIVGLGLILISIVLLWSGARLLKWVFWSYSWFLILAVIGLLLMVLSRKKR